MQSNILNRRNMLRGLGTVLALPVMESLTPTVSAAGKHAAAGVGVTETGAPLRMAFMSIPNGVQQKHWFPDKDFNLNSSMLPLEGLKEHFQVIAGLDHEHATAGKDGAGDHARANATFLTGARARKTAGSDIQVGVSLDQVAASAVRGNTRFPSLELSCDLIRNSGSCDSGYACAYQYNLAWSSPTTPVTPEPNPRLVFERLFGSGSTKQRAKNLEMRQKTEKSILDFVLEDAQQLKGELGSRDRAKLDDYLDSVRAIEQRISDTEKLGAIPNPNREVPVGVPDSFGEHMDLMYEMLALAFETDSTRVGTLLLAYDGSNRTFPEIGVAEGHHHLTHNQEQSQLADKVAKIDQFYISHLAKFLRRLSETADMDGRSLLDNSMIVYGGAIADGNRHTHANLPVILAGHGGGTLQTGRFLQVESQPMSNLFVSMLNRFGLEQVDTFGDSTGRLESV